MNRSEVNGDYDAFTELVATRSAALLRTAYLLTGDRHLAEDFLRAALIRAYALVGGMRDPRAAEASVRTAMVRALIRQRKRPAWPHDTRSAAPPDRQARPGDDVEPQPRLWPTVLTLPPGQRAVIVLRYYDDLGEPQTAAILGCSTETVNSHNTRALRTLRSYLTELEGASGGIVTATLEDRLRAELRDEAAGIELRAGYVTSTVERVLARRRQRQVRALAVAVGVIAIVALGGIALATQGPDAADETTIQSLRDTEKSRLDALVAADMPVVEQLYADDLQLVPPTGYPLTRAAYLAAVASGDLDFRTFEPVSKIQVRLYADSAVLRYKVHIDVVATPADRITHGGWLTCLYEKHDGRWQVVWEQMTAVGAFPPPD
jgi:RNA polymerase sigma-70 factor (sigma-E family)